MKRVVAIFLALVITIVFSSMSFADDTLLSSTSSVTGVLKSVICLPESIQDKVVIPLDNYKGYKFMRLSNPDRIVLDIPNNTGPSKQVKIDMKGTYVKAVRYAAIDKKNVRVVLDVVGQPQYFTEEAKGQLAIYVVKQLSKNINYYIDNGNATFVLINSKLTGSTDKLYTENYDVSGKKYTITFLSKLADVENKKIIINDAYINYVSITKDIVTRKTSISFNAKDKFTYSLIPKADASGTAVKITKTPDTGRGGDDVRNNPAYDVKYSVEGSLEKISILYANYAGYKIQRLTDPDRIVVDIPNSMISLLDNQINVNSLRIKSIRYAQYDENTVRTVIDLNGQYQFHAEERDGELAIYIEDPTYKNIQYSNNGNNIYINLVGINLLAPDNSSKLYTENRDSTGKVYTLTFPNNIGDIGSGIFQVNDDYFNSIVLVRDDSTNMTTITFNAKGYFNYNSGSSSTGTTITITNPQPVKNIKYYNSSDRVYFLLNKIKLTEGADGQIKHYTSSYDGNRYIITFSTQLANLDTGYMSIDDAYLNSLEVQNDPVSGNTSIILNAKGNFVYEVIYRDLTNDTAIDIIKPHSDQEKLVVIDAGHGGIEPGAVYSGVQEKTLNLDIALRLNALLKSRGIKTFMTRQDDNYVGLYERAYIANDLNAKLFVCIHNNAYYSSFSGTETLYYGDSSRDGFNCKNLAQIIQNNLISALGMTNRGIVPRPELVVLHATTMPAALAEIGFITNDNDRKKLLTDDFKQRAAQALCDSILQSLDKLQ